jgi:hypothetical protein
MSLTNPPCALPQNHTFLIRRVAVNPQRLPSPCYRFTGSGDRPCDAPYTPLEYAFAPWSYTVRPDAMLLYWSWSKIDVHNPLVYVDHKAQPMAFADHSWVEVTRYAVTSLSNKLLCPESRSCLTEDQICQPQPK